MQKWIKRSRYGRLMFASNYSRAAKLVNGSKEYFSTNQGEIAVRIDISSWMPTSVLRTWLGKEPIRHSGAGRNPDPSSTWTPFFNGMTDSVRHLDSRFHGNDE
jgi:hypothetical protein